MYCSLGRDAKLIAF